MSISSSIHVAANDAISFFSVAEQYSTVYVYHILLIHSSNDRHLGCTQALAIVNSNTMCMSYTTVCACVCLCVIDG